MNRRIILNIEEELVILETVYRKYVPLPGNLIFIKNNRYPLVDKQDVHKFAKLNMVSNEPFHPFICIPTVVDVLKLYIYSNSEHPEYFIKNPLFKNNEWSGGEKYIESFNMDDSDIIVEHLPEVSKADFAIIIRTIKHIFNKVKQFTDPFQDYLFDFETNTGYIVLVNKGDIKSIRFTEYLEHSKYN